MDWGLAYMKCKPKQSPKNHISHRCEKTIVIARWRAHGPVTHKICRNLELFITSWAVFLQFLHFPWLHVVMTRMGDTWQGSHRGYGLRSMQKSCGLNYVRYCLSKHFCFLWLYLQEIVAVNYQGIVPTKRWLFCWCLYFLLLFFSIAPVWHNVARPLRTIAEMSSRKSHSSLKRIRATELFTRPLPCLFPKYGSAKCTAVDC